MFKILCLIFISLIWLIFHLSSLFTYFAYISNIVFLYENSIRIYNIAKVYVEVRRYDYGSDDGA